MLNGPTKVLCWLLFCDFNADRLINYYTCEINFSSINRSNRLCELLDKGPREEETRNCRDREKVGSSYHHERVSIFFEGNSLQVDNYMSKINNRNTRTKCEYVQS